jgi:uncharacterized membrane protein
LNQDSFKPFSTPEGRILLCGLVLSAGYVVALTIGYFIAPADTEVLIGMTATSVLFGRTAGMSFGFALDYGLISVIPVNTIVEVLLVLIIYPLFVFSWQRLLVIEALDRFMRRIQSAAERHQEKIRRYGIPSLFIFVFIPFWLTGPVVGSVIGYFLGMRPWVNMSVVLSATTLACIAWALFLKALTEWASDFNPLAPLLILLTVVLLAGLGYVLEKKRR